MVARPQRAVWGRARPPTSRHGNGGWFRHARAEALARAEARQEIWRVRPPATGWSWRAPMTSPARRADSAASGDRASRPQRLESRPPRGLRSFSYRARTARREQQRRPPAPRSRGSSAPADAHAGTCHACLARKTTDRSRSIPGRRSQIRPEDDIAWRNAELQSACDPRVCSSLVRSKRPSPCPPALLARVRPRRGDHPAVFGNRSRSRCDPGRRLERVGFCP